jgi:hypothetical protein
MMPFSLAMKELSTPSGDDRLVDAMPQTAAAIQTWHHVRLTRMEEL